MRNIILSCFLILSVNIFAQQDLTLSYTTPNPGPSILDIGAIGDNFYFADLKEDGIIKLVTYDASMQVSEKRLSITEPEGKFQTSQFITLGSDIYYFRVVKNKKTFTLYAWVINTKDMKISNAPVTIYSIDAEAYINVNIKKSEQEKVIYLVITPNDFKSSTYVATYDLNFLLKQDLSVIWQNQKLYDEPVKLNSEIYFVDTQINSNDNLVIDSDHNIYLPYSEAQSKAKLKLNNEKNFIDVLSDDGTKLRTIELPYADDLLINNLSLALAGDKIVCAGFYGTDNNFQPTGIYTIEYNKNDGSKMSEKFTPFTDTYIAMLKSAGININKGGLQDMKYSMITKILDNGDAISYSQQVTPNLTGGIIVLYMKNDGTIQYNTVIRLEQMLLYNTEYVNSDLYLNNFNGYDAIVSDGNIYFFFNDNEKNAALQVTDKPDFFRAKDAAPFVIKIDKDGVATRKQLNKQGDNYFLRLHTTMINENGILARMISGSSKVENYKYVFIE